MRAGNFYALRAEVLLGKNVTKEKTPKLSGFSLEKLDWDKIAGYIEDVDGRRSASDAHDASTERHAARRWRGAGGRRAARAVGRGVPLDASATTRTILAALYQLALRLLVERDARRLAARAAVTLIGALPETAAPSRRTICCASRIRPRTAISSPTRRSRRGCLAAAAAGARAAGELLRCGGGLRRGRARADAGGAGDGRADRDDARRGGLHGERPLPAEGISLQFGASYLATQLDVFDGNAVPRARRVQRRPGRGGRRGGCRGRATTISSSKSWSSTRRGRTCGLVMENLARYRQLYAGVAPAVAGGVGLRWMRVSSGTAAANPFPADAKLTYGRMMRREVSMRTALRTTIRPMTADDIIAGGGCRARVVPFDVAADGVQARAGEQARALPRAHGGARYADRAAGDERARGARCGASWAASPRTGSHEYLLGLHRRLADGGRGAHRHRGRARALPPHGHRRAAGDRDPGAGDGGGAGSRHAGGARIERQRAAAVREVRLRAAGTAQALLHRQQRGRRDHDDARPDSRRIPRAVRGAAGSASRTSIPTCGTDVAAAGTLRRVDDGRASAGGVRWLVRRQLDAHACGFFGGQRAPRRSSIRTRRRRPAPLRLPRRRPISPPAPHVRTRSRTRRATATRRCSPAARAHVHPARAAISTTARARRRSCSTCTGSDRTRGSRRSTPASRRRATAKGSSSSRRTAPARRSTGTIPGLGGADDIAFIARSARPHRSRPVHRREARLRLRHVERRGDVVVRRLRDAGPHHGDRARRGDGVPAHVRRQSAPSRSSASAAPTTRACRSTAARRQCGQQLPGRRRRRTRCGAGRSTTAATRCRPSSSSARTSDTIAYSECTDDTAVVLFVIEGGGHTWPGSIDVPRLGATTHEVNATDQIWEFFVAQGNLRR